MQTSGLRIGIALRRHLGEIIRVENPRKYKNAISLTECSLEPVDCVLADAIPAVQVEGTDTTR